MADLERSMRVWLREVLQILRRDDSGQSLIVIVSAMTVLLGMAAFGIDAATWMVRHHQTQVVADAAALAAANCLANPGTATGTMDINGTQTPVQPCSSSTDSTQAMIVADDYAEANGIASDDLQVSVTTKPDLVTVTAKDTSSSIFASLFGLSKTMQSSAAGASWTAPTSSACSTAGSSCAAVFAMGTSCSDAEYEPDISPISFDGEQDTITGIVHSNGSIYEAAGKDETLGSTSFGSGCNIDTTGGGGDDSWGGSQTAPSTGVPTITTWPTDYTKIVTACGTGLTYTCTGPDGTPSYCTQVSTSSAGYAHASGAPTFKATDSTNGNFNYGSPSENPPSGQVWCAVGNGNPSDPSTWNGTIYLQSNSTTATGNWIGGTIEFGNSGWNLSPTITTFPVLYATGSGDCSPASSGGVCITSGANTINGSIFVPNGMLQFDGQGSTTDNFLEAQDIQFIGRQQDILGTGPTSLSGPSTTPGTDQLTQ